MSELAVGLMSGTSLDGVDAALVRISSAGDVELVHFCAATYGAQERTVILDAMERGLGRDLAILNVTLGKRFADAAEEVIRSAGANPRDIAFVASHGYTMSHEPGRATLQLGDPAVIAERVGVTVVSDFRSRDVAAGGEGAPLTPIADALLFASAQHGRALLNLGGMANVTWVPKLGSTEGVIAFDTGPGVAVIDCVVQMLDGPAPFDVDGMRAMRGSAAMDVVSELVEDPYFQRPPPKSTGREMFGSVFASRLVEHVRAASPGASNDDCIATAVELTARSVSTQLARWLPAESGRDLLASGGGARNPALMRRLEALVGGWRVKRFSDEYFDGDAKEAVVFAFLGWLTMQKRPGNIPGATGAKGPRILGRITPA